MEAPIPQPRLDDDEDVHWALSTAVALWGRGESQEALKWLRRAAEQASDVNADKRALELFKAAAEVANLVKSGASVPPPAAPAPAPPAPTPVPPPVQPPPMQEAAPPQRPPPPPVPKRSAPPPPAAPRPPSAYPPPYTAAATPVPPRASVAPAAPQRQAAPPQQRPPVPVTAPAKPVAITTAKPPAPQAIPPKRRRSFTGEQRPADAGRARPQAASPSSPHKRRRTHAGDDLHLQAPAPAAAKPANPANIWDDLDEDTRVISGKNRGDEIDQALQRLRNTPEPVAAPPDSNPYAQPEPTQIMRRIHDEATTDGSGASFDPRQVHGGYGDAPPPPSAATSPGTAGAAPGARGDAQTPAPPAAKRLDTLPSLRVAVLGTGIAGEVRLISLDAGDEPPPGAALAVLVPLSGADGEAVARLFGATE